MCSLHNFKSLPSLEQFSETSSISTLRGPGRRNKRKEKKKKDKNLAQPSGRIFENSQETATHASRQTDGPLAPNILLGAEECTSIRCRLVNGWRNRTRKREERHTFEERNGGRSKKHNNWRRKKVSPPHNTHIYSVSDIVQQTYRGSWCMPLLNQEKERGNIARQRLRRRARYISTVVSFLYPARFSVSSDPGRRPSIVARFGPLLHNFGGLAKNLATLP